MSLGQAVLAVLDDQFAQDDYKTPATTDKGRHLRMNALEKKHGSGAAAARAAGVSPSTWRRWRGTLKKVPEKLGALLGAHTDLLRHRRRHTARRALQRCTAYVCGVIYWGCDEPDPSYLNSRADGPDDGTPEEGWRCVNIGAGGATLDLSSVVTPWIAQDEEGAGAAFKTAIEDCEGAPIHAEGDQVTVTITILPKITS